MKLFLIYVESFIIGFSGAMAPGPLLTYTIQSAVKKGFWVGPRVVLGHAALELLMVAGLMMGLGEFIKLPPITVTIGLLGGLMLLWMGGELIRTESKKPFNLTREEAASAETTPTVSAVNLNPVWAGALISLANPYWLLWWAVIGLGYIMKSLDFGIIGVAVFYSGHILSDLSWYALVSAAVAGGRRLLTARVYYWLLVGCGAFLLFLGIKFIWGAVDTLDLVPRLFGKTVDLFKGGRARGI